jgi:hypothetical protein
MNMLQTLDPALLNALAAIWAGVLMVQAGLGKRVLGWRPRPTRARRGRARQR